VQGSLSLVTRPFAASQITAWPQRFWPVPAAIATRLPLAEIESTESWSVIRRGAEPEADATAPAATTATTASAAASRLSRRA